MLRSLFLPNTFSRSASITRGFNRSYSNIGKETQAALDGVPEDVLKKRTAIISQHGKSPTQSGSRLSQTWNLAFNTEETWSSPLMGWTGSADPFQAETMNFPTKEAAIAFAKEQGYNFVVDERERKTSKVIKSYGDNFRYKPPKDDNDIF